jgi:hypothetical protein
MFRSSAYEKSLFRESCSEIHALYIVIAGSIANGIILFHDGVNSSLNISMKYGLMFSQRFMFSVFKFFIKFNGTSAMS